MDKRPTRSQTSFTSLETLADVELLSRAHADGGAFVELFERHAGAIRGWALRAVGERQLANDLAAETFAAAFLAAKRSDVGSIESVVGWLHGIAANLLRYWIRSDRMRRRARDKLGVSEDAYCSHEIDEVDSRVDAEALGPRLGESLRELPKEQRLAVWARVVEELSYPETAALLRCTEQTARKRVSRGLRGLRERLEGVSR
jgi:RNA polymerase sigma factor (sigma-70 family)